MDAATNLANALEAAVLALRVFQHGNGTSELAISIADVGETALHHAGFGELLARKPDPDADVISVSQVQKRRAKVVRDAFVALACDARDDREAVALVALATRSTSPRLARLARMIAE